ncbi:vacuolar protein sorting-associated protein 36-like isoform X3 [Hibiscus syriacus]|uniref:vacuolar protein sorting-associated protein 36-like isoform X3 n=1 Tax=Hibiscus syriacus TaxID=106335 RepID=UPI001923E86A|nr:vacuolar protein sorting-associated protein 36-like isoform X3 [Hibiscus syriacus]
MSNFFSKAEVTSSGRPVFLRNEVERHLLSGVDLEPEDYRFSPLKSGILILTTHRLLWLPSSSATTLTSASSIPLASISHIFSKKSLKSVFHSPRIRFQFLVSSDGRVFDPGSGSGSGSSSGSGLASGSGAGTGTGGGLYSTDGSVRMVGVAGILRKEQEIWESTDKSLQDAFQDLNALMSKAKEMVMLAEKMRQKLLAGTSSQTSGTNDEEMGSKEEMQDWLLSVGIISPVTKESAGALYHQQLSRQLADFVRTPLERAGGMINLIDAYCLFNRARGTELISPDDMLQACSLWEKFDVPVMLRKFDSRVMVIQNKSHSDEEVFARIKSLATKPEALRNGISPTDAAMTLGIAPAMAKEHLLTAENKGLLCRDISPDGFRFYINLFPEIDPFNIYLRLKATRCFAEFSVKDYGICITWIKAVSTSG